MNTWIALIVLIVGGLLAGGLGLYVFGVNKAKRELADYVLAQPAASAVAAYTFDANGEFVDDGRAIFLNADEPLVLASTMKIVVLAAYAEAVAAGALDPAERVPVAELERHYLPLTDGGAHAAGLQRLGLPVDDFGFAQDQSATVALDDIARIMTHDSGNAETDYLIARLGAERMAAILEGGGLAHHTPIRPILGVALAAFNHETTFSKAALEQVLAEVAQGDTGTLDRLADLYLNDAGWRARQLDFLRSGGAAADPQVYHAEASRLLPLGTAREYAQMMAQIASGRFISPEASQIIQAILESAPSDWPLRLLFFDRFGAKDGATAGVLTLASYAVPRRGPAAHQNRVVVLLTSAMPLEGWMRQAQIQAHYLLPIDLAQAAGQFERLASARVIR